MGKVPSPQVPRSKDEWEMRGGRVAGRFPKCEPWQIA